MIKENDPKLSYKGKSIKNSRLLISSDETSEESLIKQYKSKLAENILKNDVDVNIEYAGKFIGDTDRILFNSKALFLSVFIGFILEILQLIPVFHRFFDVQDLIANFFGTIVGIFLIRFLFSHSFKD